MPTITGITSITATRYQVSFASINVDGRYKLTVGPDVRDALGNPLDQDSDFVVGEATDDRYVLTFSLNVIGTEGYGYTATAVPAEDLNLSVGQAGVFLILDNVDDGAAAVDLGANTFNFYGTTYSGNNKLYVSSNGIITFGAPNTASFNYQLTFESAQPTIAPFYDDLKTNTNAADQVLGRFDDLNGDSILDRLVIEWSDMTTSTTSATSRGTFQLILQLNTPIQVSSFVFNYTDLDFGSSSVTNGASATTGIKDNGSLTTSSPNRLLVNYASSSNPFISSNRGIKWTGGSSIQGQVWNDHNVDGVHDAGDEGLAGWTAYLDVNNDQLLTPGEPKVVTAADGRYTFSNLLAGDYTVRELATSGWVQTTPKELFLAVPPNANFEGGSFGMEWSTLGVASVSGAVAGVAPLQGSMQALVSNSTGAVSDIALAQFMSRPDSSLDSLVGADAIEGSAVKRIFDATAGQTVSFQWAFFTSESVNSASPGDFSFVSLLGPGGVNVFKVLASTINTFTSAPSYPYYNVTSPHTFAFTFPQAGSYTLVVGAVDVTYSFSDSAVVIDDFQLTGGTTSFGRPHRLTLSDAKTIASGNDFGNGVPNRAPTALALSTAAVLENQPVGATVGTFSTTDPDAQDTFTYSLVAGTGSTDNVAFTLSGNKLLAAASFDFEAKASYSIRVRTTDAGGLWTEKVFNILVSNVNDSPTIDAISNPASIDEDAGEQSVSLSGISSGDGTSQAISVTANSSNLALVANPTVVYTSPNGVGSLRYTPLPNAYGSSLITVRLTDAGLDGIAGNADDLFVERSFTVVVNSVNDIPVAGNDSFITDEDVSVSGNVLTNDSDLDGDTIATSLAVDAMYGSVALLADGRFTYTPSANYHGSDSFIYILSDNHGGSVVGRAAITVNSINDVPIAAADAFATNEDTAFSGNVLSNDSDVDGDALTATLKSDAANGSVNLQANGSFIYTPVANYYGSDSFSYTLSDGHGGSVTGTVSLTVNSVNDLPLAVGDAFTTNEDTAVSGNVLSNDSDVDGDTLTATLKNDATHGSVSLQANGNFTYTPTSNYNGADSFTYTLADGHGGSVTGTVALTVNAVNDLPIGTADTFTTNEDTAVSGNVLSNDGDVDGDTLTATLKSNATHGSVNLQSNGNFIYTPTANYNGADSFTYTLADGKGGNVTGTVSLTVNAVNDLPIGTADAFTTNEDTAVSGNVLIGSDKTLIL